MPSEQKGAYGGHLAPYVVRHGENVPTGGRTLAPVEFPSGSAGRLPLGMEQVAFSP